MRVLLLAVVAGLLSPMLLVHPAGGSEGASEELCAIAAVPISEGARGPYSEPTSAQVARFSAELPGALTRAGIPVLSDRMADIKLADHPEMLNCHGEDCLLSQARLLGVSRLVVPHLSPLPSAPGVRIELQLWSVAKPKAARSVEKVAEASELCSPCRPEAVPDVLSRAVGRLVQKQNLQVNLVGPPEPAPAPLLSVQDAGRPKLRVAKWVMLTLGLGAMIAGTTLWALDGSPSCDRPAGQLRCPLVLDTRTAGVAIFATGTAVLGISAVLFGVDARRGSESAPGGTLLLTAGRF